MKVTKEKLVGIFESLRYLQGKETAGWYAVGKNIRKLSPVIQEINLDRQSILEKYGEKDEAGKFKVKYQDVNGVPTEVLDFSTPEKEEECLGLLKTWGEEEVDFEFHTLSSKKIEDEKLSDGIVGILEDYVLVD